MTNIHSRVAAVALTSVSMLAINSVARAQVPNWTGFYIGANAGYAWGSSDAVSSVPCTATTSPPAYFCSTTTGLGNAAAIAAAATGSMSGNGFTGGGQLGYNLQANNVVYGIEVDFGAFNVNGALQGSAHYPQGVLQVSTANIFTAGASFDTNWLMTARGRIGWAFNNALFYGTGGLALTRLQAANFFVDNNTPPMAMSGSNTSTKVGWTLGTGVEWMMSRNWSAKVEYLYVDFGSVTVNSVGSVPGSPVAYSQSISTAVDLTAHIARVGINYKF